MQYVAYTVYPKTYGVYLNKPASALRKEKLDGGTAIPELKATVMHLVEKLLNYRYLVMIIQ